MFGYHAKMDSTKVSNNETIDDLIDYTLDFVEMPFRKNYLINEVGKEKLNALILTIDDYVFFLNRLLPTTGQVNFLLRLMDLDKINNLTNKPALVIHRLKHINEKERYAYLSEVVGKNKLQSMFDNKDFNRDDFENLLIWVLEILPDIERNKFLLDMIGLDKLKQLMPLDKETFLLDDMLNLLPPNIHSDFKTLLLPDDEFAAKQKVMKLKKSIIESDFDVGRGGVPITLPDGSIKMVPTTVGQQQWMSILQAESNEKDWVSGYVKAWNDINKFGKQAADNQASYFYPSYWKRSNVTIDYYNQFLETSMEVSQRENLVTLK